MAETAQKMSRNPITLSAVVLEMKDFNQFAGIRYDQNASQSPTIAETNPTVTRAKPALNPDATDTRTRTIREISNQLKFMLSRMRGAFRSEDNTPPGTSHWSS